jgi:hypothetical protein
MNSTTKSQQRKIRRPLGSPDLKMSTSQRPGYTRRWVNDTPGRVNDALDGGYSHVGSDKRENEDISIGTSSESRDSDLGSNVSQIVGVNEGGQPLRSYLMEIKDEYYNKDQQTKAEKIDEVDAAIRSGNISGQVGTDGRYIPTTGINIK